MSTQTYCGIYDDKFGGLTALGNLIRDAWVFDILPESQTCKGWAIGAFEQLQDDLEAEKTKYGVSVRSWPEEIQARHFRIQDEAVKRAREHGWDPDADLEDEV